MYVEARLRPDGGKSSTASFTGGGGARRPDDVAGPHRGGEKKLGEKNPKRPASETNSGALAGDRWHAAARNWCVTAEGAGVVGREAVRETVAARWADGRGASRK